jgi:hypothetical protein
VRRTTLPLLLLVQFVACGQAHVDRQNPAKLSDMTAQLDEQQCRKASQYHGYKVLEPLYQSESEEKFKECLKRRGHAVTED